MYARGGYRRYVSWVVPYSRYLFAGVRSPRRRRLIVMTSFQHFYVRNLRQTVASQVDVVPWRQPRLFTAPISLRSADLFHLHFIDELNLDLTQTRRLIEQLRRTSTPIIWTGHDLITHDKDYARFGPIFAEWATACDGMIHHSRYGEQRIRERYEFRDDCEHTVIAMAYRREIGDRSPKEPRASLEVAYGVAPAPIRIGLIGTPRVERKVVDFLEGVSRSSNRDIQVVCWSLRRGETFDQDERIAIAEVRRHVDDEEIARRLALCDLIALPIDPDGDMLTTGLAADAIGMGLGMLISDWGYLVETAGDAGIMCGHDADVIGAALDRLSVDDVRRAKSASALLRESRTWDGARGPLLEFYERVLAKHAARGSSLE